MSLNWDSSLRYVKLAALIVNYCTPKLVIECVRSLLPQLDKNSGVVIIDNASEDDSVADLRAWVASHDNKGLVRICEATRNGGYAAGVNLGIRSVDAQYYLVLNSDTIMRDGAIDSLLRTAELYPRAGVISPGLESTDGRLQPSCNRDFTPLSEFMDGAKSGRVAALLSDYVVGLGPASCSMRPPWTSFACVLLRGRMLAEIGLLDEGFFMYYEDSELCYRAWRAGWDVLHDPAIRVVHLKGQSSEFNQLAREQKRLPRYYYESRSRYFRKLYGRSGLILANLLWLLGRFISKARELIYGQPRTAPENQWLAIWTNIITPLSYQNALTPKKPSTNDSFNRAR